MRAHFSCKSMAFPGSQICSEKNIKVNVVTPELRNKGDFCLIGQFFLRLSLINFTSGSGRLEKADKDFKKQQGRLA